MARIYVIMKTTLFDAKLAEFQLGVGHYAEVELEVFGRVRPNLDGTLTLIKIDESKIDPLDLENPDVTTYNWADVRQYLQDNKADWEEPVGDLQ
jgi:hypothetical protein